MSVQLAILEEALGQSPPTTIWVELPDERLTVKELIRSHVYQKVQETNAFARATAPDANELELNEVEIRLNEKDNKDEPKADWNRELDRAIDAFQSKQIMIFVDETQVSDLDQVINVSTNTKVSFVRLTMLMGG